MDDKEERSIWDRLAVLEIKLDLLLANCPECKAEIKQHGLTIVEIYSSLKSSHKRIDEVVAEIDSTKKEVKKDIEMTKKEIYWTAGAIVTGITVVVNMIFLILERSGK